MLMPAIVLLPAAVGVYIGLRQSATRVLVAVLLLSTLGYSVVFRQGAFMHSYWNYWAILVVAVGLAIAIDALLTGIAVGRAPTDGHRCRPGRRHFRGREGGSRWGSSLRQAHQGGHRRREGGEPGVVAGPAGNGVGQPAKFLDYYTRRPSRPLPAAPSSVPPGDLVLVGRICDPDASPETVEYVLVRAAEAWQYACPSERR